MKLNKLETSENLTELFKQLNEKIYSYIFSRTGYQKSVAEDLSQDVFLKAWENRKRFDAEKSSLKNWVYIIARNSIIDYYRTNKSDRKIVLEENKGDQNRTGNHEETVDNEIIVKNLLKELPENDQELLILRYVNDLSIEEVAQVINKKYSATKVAVHRAIKKLRDLINNEK
jgi:RNA polymerase sigma-70 factor (ECF subfamily)